MQTSFWIKLRSTFQMGLQPNVQGARVCSWTETWSGHVLSLKHISNTHWVRASESECLWHVDSVSLTDSWNALETPQTAPERRVWGIRLSAPYKATKSCLFSRSSLDPNGLMDWREPRMGFAVDKQSVWLGSHLSLHTCLWEWKAWLEMCWNSFALAIYHLAPQTLGRVKSYLPQIFWACIVSPALPLSESNYCNSNSIRDLTW